MSKTVKIYNVTEIKQLIELNGDKTNFEVDFNVKSKNNEPFKALVISESDLNSGKPIDYQIVKDGIISGNIVNDKGVFQSYFLLLKSDKPTECEVTIDIKDVPLNSEIAKINQENLFKMQMQKQQEMNMQKQQEMHMRKSHNNINKENEINTLDGSGSRKVKNSKKGGINWLIVFGIIAVVGIGIWIFFNNKKKKNNQQYIQNTVTTQSTFTPVVQTPVVQTPVIQTPVIQPPVVQTPVIQPPVIQPPVIQPPVIQPSITQEIPTNTTTQNFDITSTFNENPSSLTELVTPSLPKRNEALANKLNNYFGTK